MACTATLASGAPCPCPGKYVRPDDGALVCGRHARVWSTATCPVCLHPIRARTSAHPLPKCGHVFHRGCVRTWLSRGTLTCPVCRAPCIAELRGLRLPLHRRLRILVRTLPPPPGAHFAVYVTGLLTTPMVQTALDIDDETVQRLIDAAFASESEEAFLSTGIFSGQ